MLALLKQRLDEGRVTEIRRLWIFNGLVVKATPDVVLEIAAHPSVRRVRASRTIFVPAAGTVADTTMPEPNSSMVDAPAV